MLKSLICTTSPITISLEPSMMALLSSSAILLFNLDMSSFTFCRNIPLILSLKFYCRKVHSLFVPSNLHLGSLIQLTGEVRSSARQQTLEVCLNQKTQAMSFSQQSQRYLVYSDNLDGSWHSDFRRASFLLLWGLRWSQNYMQARIGARNRNSENKALSICQLQCFDDHHVSKYKQSNSNIIPPFSSSSQYIYLSVCLLKQKLVIKCMLTISDLNKIIKFYAGRVQQRIQQLQHFACFSCSEAQDQPEYNFIAVISRYANYSTKDEKEVRLAKKLMERVLQIFQFFRAKSNNQNLLGIIQGRLERELAGFVNVLPVRLGEMFSYIHLVTKRGCVIRPPAAQKKRMLSKSIIREPLKIQEKMTTTFSLMNVHKRTALSNSSNKHIRIAPSQKWKLQDAMNGIWSGLDLDRAHLMRIKETNESLIYKDAMRRNQNIAGLMRRYDRRRVRRTTLTEFYQESRDTAILTQVKFNTVKGWAKKRRPVLASRKKHYSIKENISILA